MNYESVIKYAMEMEMYGHNFFKEQGEKFENPTTKSLFLNLADVELQHYEFLKNTLDNYKESEKFTVLEETLNFNDEDLIFESRKESEHIDTALEQSDVPDLTVLRMAYLIEKDFNEFYTEVGNKVEDEELKKLFNKLAEWEAGHELLFKKQYDKKMHEYFSIPLGG